MDVKVHETLRRCGKGAASIQDNAPPCNPMYQAFARWNCLQPDVQWMLDKKAFKKQILGKLVWYFYQSWRNDHSHLLYEGRDVIVADE